MRITRGMSRAWASCTRKCLWACLTPHSALIEADGDSAVGSAFRHGRVLRIGRAADPTHSAGPAGAGRRTGWPRVVAGASYEARRFGARSAMPMHQARRLVGRPPWCCRRGARFTARRAAACSTPSVMWCRSLNSCRSTKRSGSPRTRGCECRRRRAVLRGTAVEGSD